MPPTKHTPEKEILKLERRLATIWYARGKILTDYVQFVALFL